MGRPAKHDTEDFLDAAVALFAADGARAVTLAAVADRLGAANGSIYYRFPDRAALLRAVWSRTTERFHRGYLEKLGAQPTITDAIDTTAWVVEWCRDNLEQAQVLQAGPRVFGGDVRPAQEPAADDEVQFIRRLAATLSKGSAATPDQIAFAIIDLPLAVIRRHLQAGRAPGDREIDLVRGLASAILACPESTGSGATDQR